MSDEPSLRELRDRIEIARRHAIKPNPTVSDLVHVDWLRDRLAAEIDAELFDVENEPFGWRCRLCGVRAVWPGLASIPASDLVLQMFWMSARATYHAAEKHSPKRATGGDL